MKLLASVLILMNFFPPAFAFGPPAVDANNEGVQKLELKDPQGAQKDFLDALKRDPVNPVYHYNLGAGFAEGGDQGNSYSEYDSVEASRTADNELKFRAMFNAGNSAVQDKDIGKALGYYQKALKYKPDSKEVRWNIELALKEMDQQKSGGEDDKDKKDDKKDEKKDKKMDKGKGDDEKDESSGQEPKKPQPKSTPRPYDGKSLSEPEVKRVLEELKRQEEAIRAKQFDDKKRKETNVDKDW